MNKFTMKSVQNEKKRNKSGRNTKIVMYSKP